MAQDSKGKADAKKRVLYLMFHAFHKRVHCLIHAVEEIVTKSKEERKRKRMRERERERDE